MHLPLSTVPISLLFLCFLLAAYAYYKHRRWAAERGRAEVMVHTIRNLRKSCRKMELKAVRADSAAKRLQKDLTELQIINSTQDSRRRYVHTAASAFNQTTNKQLRALQLLATKFSDKLEEAVGDIKYAAEGFDSVLEAEGQLLNEEQGQTNA